MTEAEAHRIVTGIVRTYGSYLRNVLMKRGVPARDVDDELQQVWEAVRQNVGRLRGKVQIWLVRTAINRAGNYYQERLKRRRVVQGLEHDFRERDPDAEEDPIGVDFRDESPDSEELLIGAEIARLVDSLEPGLRAVMKASMSGETIEEISESLRIPKGTCNSRLRRAREQIKAALARNDIFSPAFRKPS